MNMNLKILNICACISLHIVMVVSKHLKSTWYIVPIVSEVTSLTIIVPKYPILSRYCITVHLKLRSDTGIQLQSTKQTSDINSI